MLVNTSPKICSECVSKVRRCDTCYKHYPGVDVSDIGDGRTVCLNCITDLHICSRCTKLNKADNMCEVGDGTVICSKCLDALLIKNGE